jgi:predicted ATPase/DNA-binding SARP family transcriptional activator
MYLSLLGPPSVTLNGKTLTLGVKPLSLLAYLALEGRTTRRDLAFLLWPSSPNPFNNLSVAKGYLEKKLGQGFLLVEPEHLSLAADVTSDIAHFRAHCGATAQYMAAWLLWRGGFLTGLRLQDWESGLGEAFEDWLYQSREQLNGERRTLAATLAKQKLQGDDLAAALPYLQVAQSCEGDPNEDCTRWLMLLLASQGQFAAAEAVYSKLYQVLRDDLGVSPTQASQQVLLLLRERDTAACEAVLRAEVGTNSNASSSILVNTGDVISKTAIKRPFIGRDQPLAQALAWLEQQPVAVVTIEGEPGAGKTRLAEEIIAQLGQHLGQQLGQYQTMTAVSPQYGLYLGLFAGLAREKLQGGAAKAVADLPNEWRDALARWLPACLSTTAAALPPELERRALFYGLRTLLFPAQPLIVLLDDLQWSDEASLDFIHFLLDEVGGQHKLSLLLTIRSTEASRGDVGRLLGRLARQNLGQSIILPPLATTDVAALAAANGYGGDLERLARRSGGNPFYALELMRSHDDDLAQLPLGVHEVLRARLGQLPNTALQVLEVLEVAGEHHTTAFLRKISGRSLEELSEALDLLERAALLRVGAGLRFAHDIVREAVGQQLTLARRSLLHLRAARGLGQHLAHTVARAEHFWQAQAAWDDGDVAAVHESLLLAGRQTGIQGDLATALLWFERAVGVGGDPLALRLERASILERFSKHQEALAELEDLSNSAQALTNPVFLAKVNVQYGFLLQRHYYQYDKAVAVFRQALDSLAQYGQQHERAVQETTSDALHNLGIVLYLQKNPSEALEYYQKAYKLRLNLADPSRIADTLGGMGVCEMYLGHANAEAHLRQCLAQREALGDVLGVTRVLTSLSSWAIKTGDLMLAIAFRERICTLQDHLGDTNDLALAFNNLGALYQEQGHLTTAHQHYLKAKQIFDSLNLPPHEAVLENLAEVEALLAQQAQ